MVTPTPEKLATQVAALASKGVAEERRPQLALGTPDHLQTTALASLESDAPSASAVEAPSVNEARASLESEAAQAQARQRQEVERNDERRHA